jgi:rsbT co-antagonist protein RsbR
MAPAETAYKPLDGKDEGLAMTPNEISSVAQLASDYEQDILTEWVAQLKEAGATRTGRLKESELQTQCRSVIEELRKALAVGGTQFSHPAYEPLRELLSSISRSRALQGFSADEIALFVLSLKRPLLDRLRKSGGEAMQLVWPVTLLIDELAIHTMATYQKSREEVIVRQQREIAELSTPVVKLWEGVLALPVIGTLDSQRTQIVMENLLQSIVDEEATIAIIDITGVPTVDTLTAQYLLKTVAAARLMGADCIISGIRPQIAQTIVHLGVELNVVSKATLADAFALALRRIGRAVTKVKGEPRADAASE